MIPATSDDRLFVLDGWRGISILLVMATHLLPLDALARGLNSTAGPMGMALFFTLSGFLITRILLREGGLTDFLIRRFARIVPLAWVAMLVVLALESPPPATWAANFLFYANLPPLQLVDPIFHLWSLCVEMQFYVGITIVVALTGRRGLYLMPLICVAITAYRITDGSHIDVVTWLRVDEILAGSTLALAYAGRLGQTPKSLLARLNPYVLVALLFVTSHPDGEFMNYFRPYIAALLIGSTLFAPPLRVEALLKSQVLAYIARISYALYVIHGILPSTWLGSGDMIVKYLKRPLLIAITFALAHVSTYQYERRCIAYGKLLAARLNAPNTKPQPA